MSIIRRVWGIHRTVRHFCKNSSLANTSLIMALHSVMNNRYSFPGYLYFPFYSLIVVLDLLNIET